MDRYKEWRIHSFFQWRAFTFCRYDPVMQGLVLSHALGHVLQGEGDVRIDLLERAIQHMRATADYSVYYGEGRDRYDVRGRTAHESVFNVKDGNYRCPNSQQGYTGFTTWTSGLAWAICGFAEELEWIDTHDEAPFATFGGKDAIVSFMLKPQKLPAIFILKIHRSMAFLIGIPARRNFIKWKII